jgi:hypothetical protein
LVVMTKTALQSKKVAVPRDAQADATVKGSIDEADG